MTTNTIYSLKYIRSLSWGRKKNREPEFVQRLKFFEMFFFGIKTFHYSVNNLKRNCYGEGDEAL